MSSQGEANGEGSPPLPLLLPHPSLLFAFYQLWHGRTDKQNRWPRFKSGRRCGRRGAPRHRRLLLCYSSCSARSEGRAWVTPHPQSQGGKGPWARGHCGVGGCLEWAAGEFKHDGEGGSSREGQGGGNMRGRGSHLGGRWICTWGHAWLHRGGGAQPFPAQTCHQSSPTSRRDAPWPRC